MQRVETAGLNTSQNAIIELAMIKFTCLPDDRIAAVTSVYSSFNEPTIPIPEEVVELTRITDEMVAGHSIDPDAVVAFVSAPKGAAKMPKQDFKAIARLTVEQEAGTLFRCDSLDRQ